MGNGLCGPTGTRRRKWEDLCRRLFSLEVARHQRHYDGSPGSGYDSALSHGKVLYGTALDISAGFSSFNPYMPRPYDFVGCVVSLPQQQNT